jgi:hypothetical protein
LAQLENAYIILPTRVTEDYSIVPTTARYVDIQEDLTFVRINIEPSVHLHSSIYKISTEDLIPKLRNFVNKGGKVLFVPPDRQKNPFAFGIHAADQLYPVCFK